MKKRVEDLVAELVPEQQDIVNRLRALIRKTVPDVVETSKWGNVTFLLNDKNFAAIMLGYKDHLNLGFWQGARLKSSLLEGTGKGIRHIKVWKASDIKEREFASVIEQAAKLNS
jgi:hypothetical protein